MKRLTCIASLLVLVVALLLPALPAAAAPSIDGWTLSVMEWFADWLQPLGPGSDVALEAGSSEDPTPPTSDSDDPSLATGDPDEPADSGSETESHPEYDPYG